MANVLEILEKRGFIDQKTSEEIKKHLDKPIKLYIGFDPTANSLHIGNLIGIVALRWFQMHGHKIYAMTGTATAKIGDPSGKDLERPLLSEELVLENSKAIEDQLKQILDNHEGAKPEFINNNSWFKKINFIDFLRDIGKHFRVNIMLSKESVKTRLNSQDGMSFTEFSYQMLQAYDFCHLQKNEGISLQMGGSDQWGNITAGIELTRKLLQKQVFGLTFPLLTRSDGKKFGKSEKGAIFLSEKLVSPYDFYQYFIRVTDMDVIKLLKMLTFLDIEKIEKIEKQMQEESYIPNTAQKILADEVTKFVHGEENLKIAQETTLLAKPGKSTILDKNTLKVLAKDLKSFKFSKNEIFSLKICDLFLKVNLTSSKSEATKLIKNGGAYLNNKKLSDIAKTISEDDLIAKKYILLAKGKKQKVLIIVE
jgi:tyrosyl-tRNA synthetase